MGGVFGGLLGALEPVGGGLLWLLVGEKAWSDGGRAVREVVGGVLVGTVFGILVGGFIGFVIALANSAVISMLLASTVGFAVVGGIVGFVAFLVIVLSLEALRFALEGGK